MSTIHAEAAYRRAAAAFNDPTLALLHGRYAAFVIAVLSTMFTADRPAVTVADAHVEVQDMVDQLRAAGVDDQERALPHGSGREICRYWVRVGWLVPHLEDNVEVYRLSAQAVGALEIAGRAGGGRALVSRSRVRTLLDSVEELSHSAGTDPVARLARLMERRRQIDEEIARLEAGHIEPADDDELLEEALHVLHLSRELPADFARVAEAIKQMQRHVVAELRRDERPAAEVLREYLRQGQQIMDATPEGRAFAGALNLIGEPEHIDELTAQLRELANQPFAQLLHTNQREELRAIAKRVEQGVHEVLTAQRRASHVITAQVRTHDPIRDREVDDLLRSVMASLQTWVPSSKAGEKVDPLRRLPTAGVRNLRQTLSDLTPPSVPEPLRRDGDHGDVEFPENDTRFWGGPHYLELETRLRTLAGEEHDLADVFESGPDELRRPVDLLGLLELMHKDGLVEQENVSVVRARRPDGTWRRFAFGAVTSTPAKEETDDGRN